MKWLTKCLLFICILLTSGSSHIPLSFTGFKLTNNDNLIIQQHRTNDAEFTSVLPEKDSFVLQIIEDDEDDISSRIKKYKQYASTLFILITSGTLPFISVRLVQLQLDNRLINAFNSPKRYIQLRAIRI